MKKISAITIILVLGFIGITVQSGLAQQPNPSQQETNDWRKKGPCNDPWVSKAVSYAYSSVRLAHTSNGSDGECDITQYNKGQWNSYNELVIAVEKRRNELSSVKLRFASIMHSSTQLVVLLDEKNKIVGAAGILSHNGGTLVGNDGASINEAISKALANLVAAGAGNMVAAGAGNMVAAGAGNLADILKAAKVVPTAGGRWTAEQIKANMEKANLISNATASNYNPSSYRLSATEAKKVVKLGSKFFLIK